MAKSEPPYPWDELIKGLIGIGVIVSIFHLSKPGEDVLNVVLRALIEGTGHVLNTTYRSFEGFIFHTLRYYWLPFVVLLATWYVFPDIVDDFLFLVYLGYKRYVNLFFSEGNKS